MRKPRRGSGSLRGRPCTQRPDPIFIGRRNCGNPPRSALEGDRREKLRKMRIQLSLVRFGEQNPSAVTADASKGRCPLTRRTFDQRLKVLCHEVGLPAPRGSFVADPGPTHPAPDANTPAHKVFNRLSAQVGHRLPHLPRLSRSGGVPLPRTGLPRRHSAVFSHALLASAQVDYPPSHFSAIHTAPDLRDESPKVTRGSAHVTRQCR